MNGLAHVFLHVGLCNSIAKLPATAPIAMHVRLSFQKGEPPFDQTFKILRGEGQAAVLEFDAGRGVYRLQVETAKVGGCSAVRYLDIMPDQNRRVDVTLDDLPQPPPQPTLLMEGSAPTSFLYLKPTYVLFDKSAVCDKPIPAPLPSHIDVDYDQGAYYLAMYGDPSLVGANPLFALRLRTPTGLAHYVRIKLPFDIVGVWNGWPSNVHFNIDEDMIDEFATQKPDTLLCPKLWSTSAG